MSMNSPRLALVAAGALALALASAGPASTQVRAINDFNQCDGFGAPSPGGDGMTAEATVGGGWWIAPPGNGDMTRDPTPVGPDGIVHCDKAMSDPLIERYWMRRVSLLRAKAVHQLAVRDSRAALATLDQIGAATAADADSFFHRSLMVGATLVRAYALKDTNPAEADALVAEALKARPFSRQVLVAAMTIGGEAASRERRRDLAQQMARLQPKLTDYLYLEDLELGDFRSAVGMFSGLTPRYEERQGWVYSVFSPTATVENNARASVYWATRHGQQAFALSALGQYEAARETLRAGRERLDASTADRGNRGKTRLSDRQAREKSLVAQARHTGNAILDYWTLMVERREMISAGRAREAVASIRAKPMQDDFAAAAIMDALRAALPGDSEVAALPLVKFRPTPLGAPSLRQMFETLPDAETPRQRPGYDNRLGLIRETDGYSVSDDDGVTLVRFVGFGAVPGQMVEEAALLRAAEEAQRRGKTGLILIERSDVRTFIVDSYQQPTNQGRPGGYETRLKLVYVDAGNLPETYRATPWRVIPAADVIAALKPHYAK